MEKSTSTEVDVIAPRECVICGNLLEVSQIEDGEDMCRSCKDLEELKQSKWQAKK
jgi:hypothetical protein